uniref:Uncharacterized protein n=1 Tax=Manihot esculenta TaxID=3983 RepID=A0A2C9V8K3_MANES
MEMENDGEEGEGHGSNWYTCWWLRCYDRENGLGRTVGVDFGKNRELPIMEMGAADMFWRVTWATFQADTEEGKRIGRNEGRLG